MFLTEGEVDIELMSNVAAFEGTKVGSVTEPC